MDIHERIKLWERQDGLSLFDNLGLANDSNILDYGCGFGHYSVLASRAICRGRVYAVDINKGCLNHINEVIKLEELNNIELKMGNKDYSLDFEDDYFDMIMYYDILHGNGFHRFTLLEEAQRTLKKNGILSILPFHMSNFTDKDGKKKKYSYEKLVKEVEAYGFQVITSLSKIGIHFEKYHSPYYISKGGITFDDLEKAEILTFRKV
ncbi:class I SAM-dependent methyltransferase [Clostridium sp. YIM B02505]|uniref:Class I SAM-dependent methyltransferase n=1 Tax=Clostridium yunnanense TaxID=2800325 RepID=A0ABS1EUP8_9CLOT|nr:class I SAM-dependent methyltransferase [Clostridium yunnanense]MBK1813018.1 class I SAM-dependent methyltransferase [Clostridium yunnanense]